MNYYRDSVTQKSWRFLTELARKYRFVLIGGWAVWLYTKQLKSKDIDIVVDLNQLAKLKTRFDLVKNSRLKKTYAVPEINLNRHQFAKLKARWLENAPR